MERLVSMKEAAQMLGVGRASLYKLRELDDFPPAVEISPRRVAFKASSLEAWIQSRPVATETEDFEARQARGRKGAAVIKKAAAQRRGQAGGPSK